MRCDIRSFYTSWSLGDRDSRWHLVNLPIDKKYKIRNRLSVIMDIQIIRQTIMRQALQQMALQQFGDMVKAVVDVEQGIMAIGGELHSDEEAALLDQGSQQKHLWEINLYPNQPHPAWIEYDSMINVRPSQGNRSRSVERVDIREAIIAIVRRLTEESAT